MNSERQPDPNRPANNPLYPHLKVKEKLYKSAAEMEYRITEYFKQCKDNTEEVMSASGVIKELKRPLMPSIEELSAFLGMDTQTLMVYQREEGYEDFHDLVKLTKAKILGAKSSGLINGKGSTTGIIFDMVNNHNYKNKSEVETDNKNETKIIISYEG